MSAIARRPAAEVAPGRIHRACASSFLRNLQVFTAGAVPSDTPPTLLGPLARRTTPTRAGRRDVPYGPGGNDGNGGASGTGSGGRDRQHGRRRGGERRTPPHV